MKLEFQHQKDRRYDADWRGTKEMGKGYQVPNVEVFTDQLPRRFDTTLFSPRTDSRTGRYVIPVSLSVNEDNLVMKAKYPHDGKTPELSLYPKQFPENGLEVLLFDPNNKQGYGRLNPKEEKK